MKVTLLCVLSALALSASAFEAKGNEVLCNKPVEEQSESIKNKINYEGFQTLTNYSTEEEVENTISTIEKIDVQICFDYSYEGISKNEINENNH